MKALSKLKAEEGIWMTDVPEPEVGHNDLLIKIRKTAICGTDVHIYNWDDWSQKTIPVPMVVGHEYVGEVVGIGQEVKGFKIGDRVSGEGHITCGHCRNCRGGRTHLCRNTTGVGVNRPGCFAEYLVIPAFNAFKIPDNISDDLASIFDPFGNAVHTALSFDLVGEDVLVSGAGPIGVMAAAVAKHVGARHVVITDVNEYRLELARKTGRHPRGQRREREPERRYGGAGNDRRVRCGSGDVRRAAGVSYHAGHHESRRSYCDAGDSAIRYVYRLDKSYL